MHFHAFLCYTDKQRFHVDQSVPGQNLGNLEISSSDFNETLTGQELLPRSTLCASGKPLVSTPKKEETLRRNVPESAGAPTGRTLRSVIFHSVMALGPAGIPWLSLDSRDRAVGMYEPGLVPEVRHRDQFGQSTTAASYTARAPISSEVFGIDPPIW